MFRVITIAIFTRIFSTNSFLSWRRMENGSEKVEEDSSAMTPKKPNKHEIGDRTGGPKQICNPKVSCIICGATLRLSKLVSHQKLVHRNIKADVSKCTFCNLPMLNRSLKRHLRRKHSAEIKGKKVFQELLDGLDETTLQKPEKKDAANQCTPPQTVADMYVEQDDEFLDLVISIATTK